MACMQAKLVNGLLKQKTNTNLQFTKMATKKNNIKPAPVKKAVKKAIPAKKVIKKSLPVKKAVKKAAAPAKKTVQKNTLPVHIHPGTSTGNTGFIAQNSIASVENKLNHIIQQLQPPQKAVEAKSATDQPLPVQTSFKNSVQDIIIDHETLIARNKIKHELENCGDIYYMTEVEKNKMVETVKQFKADMIFDLLFFAASAFVLGYIFGNKAGKMETVEYVEANFNLIPKN